MAAESGDKMSKGLNLSTLLVGMLVLGSLWGLSEVVLGGGLKAVNFPYRSGLLTGIGMMITAITLSGFRKSAMPVGIGMVSALVILLAIPVLHVSVMCKANSCVAVVTEATSLGIVGTIMANPMRKNIYARVGAGGLAAVIASIGFYFIGTHVAPCNYLLSFPTVSSFVMKEGITWGAFSAVLLPIGYLVGKKLTVSSIEFVREKKFFYYAAIVGIITLCWSVSAFAISAGL